MSRSSIPGEKGPPGQVFFAESPAQRSSRERRPPTPTGCRAVSKADVQPGPEEPPPQPGSSAQLQKAAASSDDTGSKLDQLKPPGGLKAQGVLTEVDFEEQKARLLG